jgi:hypothetical protein
LASKIKILRAVAAAVGVKPPANESESSSFLKQILPLWDTVVEDFTTRHAWTWGTDTRDITATTDTPPPPWAYSYALPVDRTLIRDVTDANGNKVNYDVEGVRVVSDSAGPLKLRINTGTSPGTWPGDFAKCVQETLEGYCWKGLRDDYNRGQALIEAVDPPRGLGKLQKAITRDQRQRLPKQPFQGSIYKAFKGAAVTRRSRDG